MTWWIRNVYPTNILNIISTWNEFRTFIEATKPLFFDLRSLVVIIFRRMGKIIKKMYEEHPSALMSRRRSGSWAARPLFLLFVGLDLNLWIDPTQCTEITVAWRRHATWEVPTRIEERRSPQSCKGGGGPNFAYT